ncbi:MAG: GLPGLI family protein [Lewinella sp.]
MFKVKYILFLFASLFSIDLAAQLPSAEVVGGVSYIQVLSFPGEDPVENNYDFFFSQSQGLFIRQNESEHRAGNGLKPEVNETEEGTSVSYDFSTEHRWPMHTDVTNEEVLQEVILFSRGKNQEYLVKEKKFPVRWKLTQEEKNIGSILCRKATGFFRGREYIAWYAPEIPVRLGPWKFEGLPGLILEIYDTRKHVFFSATSVQLPLAVTELPDTWLTAKKEVQVISLKECVAITRNQKDEAVQAIMARLPRGAVLELEDKEPNKIETSYEFDHE